MGIQITPIFNINRSNFDVDNLTVNDDASISGDLDGNTATFNSLTVMQPMEIGGLSLTGKSGILQEIECTGSQTVYCLFEGGNSSPSSYFLTILPMIPSTYYTGTIKVAFSATTTSRIFIHNIDGTISTTTLTGNNTWDTITIPRGSIGIYFRGSLSTTTNVKIGFTNNYTPLPPL